MVLATLSLNAKLALNLVQKHKSRPTSHTPKRRYKAFLELPEDLRKQTTELDTVMGKKTDHKVILILYHRPSDLQLAILLEEKHVPK